MNIPLHDFEDLVRYCSRAVSFASATGRFGTGTVSFGIAAALLAALYELKIKFFARYIVCLDRRSRRDCTNIALQIDPKISEAAMSKSTDLNRLYSRDEARHDREILQVAGQAG
ncbi:hypothetical protein [Rhizobium sp. P44RR-XXIV]|uniref:hypothetical protein n=1 Tax=Rhizobium sp. P44RR-XXIV TaxID=1921145 RepID=UPI0009850B86|nr:hypothetical protein [Rhizobium sp. P44RR-XXIV]TIX87845.1 hypothetical protein BSK43_033930 [Rhizobium sp. P44RR-XXIV]